MSYFKMSFLNTLAALLILSGCVDRLTIEEDNFQDLLVVEGLITNAEGPYTVKLSRTSKYQDLVVPKETGAVVSVLDNMGNSFEFNEVTPGTYQTYSPIKGEIGNSYKIRITTSNDKVYESYPEVMPEVPNIDSISFDFQTAQYYDRDNVLKTKEVARFYAAFKDILGKRNFYKWNYESTAQVEAQLANPPFMMCWAKEFPVYFLNIMDDSNLDGNYIRKYPIASVDVNYRFAQNYYFKAQVVSLSENAYIFWKSVEDQIKNVGTIFDPPPAKIKGNLFNINDPNEVVLGYFGASAVAEKSSFLTPVDVPFQIQLTDCSLYLGGPGPPPPTCTNCLNYPNSTNIKPDFFK